jgi:nucleoside-diphosphate-sugar epimerase
MQILVTGAGGFLAGVIARMLRARGDTVVSLSRQRYPALDALGIRQVSGDLADPAAVLAAARGCDAVIHVAAKAGAWGSYAEYYQPNVLGTRNVLEACKRLGIRRLVYTSTPSVAHGGGDLEGVDESVPYPTRFHAHYPATKAEAEQLVLAANSATLATVALRPHLIWGPGDNNLMPRLIQRAKSGRLAIVGTPKLIDTTYVDNAAEAHVMALDALGPGSACAGKPYFISNGEPLRMDEILNKLLACTDLPPIRKRVPLPVAWVAGALMEAAWTVLRLQSEPPMTRFIASQFATAHWYRIDAAKRDFGWTPRVSITEGLARLKAALATDR